MTWGTNKAPGSGAVNIAPKLRHVVWIDRFGTRPSQPFRGGYGEDLQRLERLARASAG